MVHLAAGAEWRDEKYTIGAGGRPSWEVGPYAPQGRGARRSSAADEYDRGRDVEAAAAADVEPGRRRDAGVRLQTDLETRSRGEDESVA